MTRLSQQSLFGIQDVPNNLKFRQFRQLGEISISGIRSVDPKYLEARSKLDPLATMSVALQASWFHPISMLPRTATVGSVTQSTGFLESKQDIFAT
ncbi:hypothetical protein J6590_091365 [Homalodisca vitripennis]|nr:hypothetical protein J6590_091365 [Homalodisca vitripennis]